MSWLGGKRLSPYELAIMIAGWLRLTALMYVAADRTRPHCRIGSRSWLAKYASSIVVSSGLGLPNSCAAIFSSITACGRRVSLPYSEYSRSLHVLMATTALIRGSNAEAIMLMPAPYEAPAVPMRAGSAAVLAINQSIAAETSDMSFGPAVSI